MLPTGRNLHGFDPFGIPPPLPSRDGERLAARVLERYMKIDGRLPETIAVVLLGNRQSENGGAAARQAMALMGARPRLDAYKPRLRCEPDPAR